MTKVTPIACVIEERPKLTILFISLRTSSSLSGRDDIFDVDTRVEEETDEQEAMCRLRVQDGYRRC